jgi:hypothetical protein
MPEKKIKGGIPAARRIPAGLGPDALRKPADSR